MHFPPFLDPSLHWLLAQTPTPSPTATSTAAQLDLLRQQVDLLVKQNGQLTADFTERFKLMVEENKSLSESFSKFVSTMQFVLVVFGFLGAVIAYIFKQNLSDAKAVAAQMISQEVDRHVTELVSSEIETVRRSFQQERVVGSTVVDYLVVNGTQEPKEVGLLRLRGFQNVRFLTDAALLRRNPADVVVVDLVHWQDTSGQGFSALSADDDREQVGQQLLEALIQDLPEASFIVVYVNGQLKFLRVLMQRCPIASANYSVTLIGMVADAAYVAYGARGRS